MRGNISNKKQKPTMSTMLRRLICVILVPMSIVITVLIGILCWNSFQYRTILQNVTAASAFNQDFKSDVDLKMFYYVSDSAYADGKPIEEVESARELAESLLKQTTEKDSIDSIESVRDLCITLETRMEEVDDAETYDEGMTQLENNIYILTDLIQTYMYDYLYYESVRAGTVHYRYNSDSVCFSCIYDYVLCGKNYRNYRIPSNAACRKSERYYKGRF